MGMPNVNISFEGKATTAIKRSANGIVALVLHDNTITVTKGAVPYADISEIKASDWTEENIDYIQKAFLGTPKKVICIRIPVESTDYNTAYKSLQSLKWNFLAIPQILDSEVENVASWIKSKRDNDKKKIKAVLPNCAADHEGIINFTTDEIETKEKVYATNEYCPRIAGILAGLPFTRSATFFELSEVISVADHDDPNGDIDKGQLILVNDGEVVKIGRGVNSLTSFTVTKMKQWSKIKIVEGMDLITDDIRDVFNKDYIGDVNNDYDNQVLFIVSVNAYFKRLVAENILNKNYENKADVDIASQRLAWEEVGTATEDWDDLKVKKMSFEDQVFLSGDVKILDAMEGLNFNIAM